MSNELVQHKPAVDAIALLQKAVESNIDVAALEKLVDLQERVLARNAEAEFNAAMKAFQSECPIIDKPKMGGKAKYAPLSYIRTRIQHLLDKHGFSYSFDTEFQTEMVKAICTVKHIGGHSTHSSFTAPIDRDAKAMNITQKAASAVSYAKRYALVGAFGIETGGDDDGTALDTRLVNEDEFIGLKTRWFNAIDKRATKTKEEREDKFSEWACETIGRDFTAVSINNWTYSDYRTCDNAINDAERLKDGDELPIGSEAADAILGDELTEEEKEEIRQQELLEAEQ